MTIDCKQPEKVHRFEHSTSEILLPECFTFPFYYQPHPLAQLASDQLQRYLLGQEDWQHNFGLDNTHGGLVIGKMFGVLVVQDQNSELGFLAGFSGKLANSNQHQYFVPPVFDMLVEGGFYTEGEAKLNAMNREIEDLEANSDWKALKNKLESSILCGNREVEHLKLSIKTSKERRKGVRLGTRLEDMPETAERLRNESIREQLHLKDTKRKWVIEQSKIRGEILIFQNKADVLKAARKALSAELQQQLFKQYSFYDKTKSLKSLLDIFVKGEGIVPPAGAGECAAPKLLHYAFAHGLKPIALAEFWWGQSPPGEIRQHGHFYPVCRSKCRPILKHMLQGIKTDPNPMEQLPAADKRIEVLYKDDDIAIIHKPHELLSVPGKSVHLSVFTQASALFPDATGPLMVHRLDMSTSGVMVIALNIKSYRNLQKQFLRKTIKKLYVAVLERDISNEVALEGKIDLPLRVDLDDRPRQMVCYEHGRNALTSYHIESSRNNQTRITFFPHTGRTHQLRVHAAHPSGLNAPILGDDLYGSVADRLYLHAESIQLRHPVSHEWMTFEVKAPF